LVEALTVIIWSAASAPRARRRAARSRAQPRFGVLRFREGV